jgi:hypothetical protein
MTTKTTRIGNGTYVDREDDVIGYFKTREAAVKAYIAHYRTGDGCLPKVSKKKGFLGLWYVIFPK